jgi:hypothetical protein
MTVENDFWEHEREDDHIGVYPLRMPAVEYLIHPQDSESIEFHPISKEMRPHTHIIIEDSKHERKQKLALHIDRWHTPLRS